MPKYLNDIVLIEAFSFCSLYVNKISWCLHLYDRKQQEYSRIEIE